MARGSTPPPIAAAPHAAAIQPRRAPSASDYEKTRVLDQRRANMKKVYR